MESVLGRTMVPGLCGAAREDRRKERREKMAVPLQKEYAMAGADSVDTEILSLVRSS